MVRVQLRAGPSCLAHSSSSLPTTAAERAARLEVCGAERCVEPGGVWSPALPSRSRRDKRHQLSIFLCFSSAQAVCSEHCLGLHLPAGSSPAGSGGAAEHPACPRRT